MADEALRVKLLALVEQWRRSRDERNSRGDAARAAGDYDHGDNLYWRAAIFDRCAYQLAALLAESEPPALKLGHSYRGVLRCDEYHYHQTACIDSSGPCRVVGCGQPLGAH